MALDDSSIAILGGEIPTQDGIAISPDMKTYNLDTDAWTENPGTLRALIVVHVLLFFLGGKSPPAICN